MPFQKKKEVMVHYDRRVVVKQKLQKLMVQMLETN